MNPISDRTSSADPARAAEEAFSDYLRLVDEGSDIDFDAFCAERPNLSEALQSLRADWARMAGMVDDLGSSFPGDGPPPTEPELEIPGGNGAPHGNENGPDSVHGTDTARAPSEMSATFELDVEGRGAARAGRPGNNPVANVIERLSKSKLGAEVP